MLDKQPELLFTLRGNGFLRFDSESSGTRSRRRRRTGCGCRFPFGYIRHQPGLIIVAVIVVLFRVLNSQEGRGWPSFFMNWRRMRVPGKCQHVPPAVCQCFRMMLAWAECFRFFHDALQVREGGKRDKELEGLVFHVSRRRARRKSRKGRDREDGRALKRSSLFMMPVRKKRLPAIMPSVM